MIEALKHNREAVLKAIRENDALLKTWLRDHKDLAGIVLRGAEVKSLRQGRASIAEAYGRISEGEVWLENLHIPPYAHDSTAAEYDPRRPRKLLLHRGEIERLTGKDPSSLAKSLRLGVYRGVKRGTHWYVPASELPRIRARVLRVGRWTTLERVRYERNHLTLLAASDQGMRNRVKLSSAGYLEGYRRGKANVDMQLLSRYSDGVIALTGIAVNSAIVLIDAANARRRSGMTVLHAALYAARRRVVPIIITSTTTIAGLFSLAVGLGGHSLIWGPVAASIVWGLGLSTLLTLFVIPLLYAELMPEHRSRRIRSA